MFNVKEIYLRNIEGRDQMIENLNLTFPHCRGTTQAHPIRYSFVGTRTHYLAIHLILQIPKLINASAENLDFKTGKPSEQSLSVHHTGGLVRFPLAI